MAWITADWYSKERKIILQPQKTDTDCFKVIKIRQDYSCVQCQKKIKKGSRAYGSNYMRLCLSCGRNFSDEALAEFKKLTDWIKKNQKLHDKNKDKWNSENIVANL